MHLDLSLKLRQISVLYRGLRNFSFSKRPTKAEGEGDWWCEGGFDCNIDELESGRNDCKASLTQTLLALNSEAVEDMLKFPFKKSARE